MDEQIEVLIDNTLAAILTHGVSPEGRNLLDLAYRFLRDAINLPAMHDATRLPIQLEAIERATHLADCAMALTPRDHQQARRVLSALIQSAIQLSSSLDKVSSD